MVDGPMMSLQGEPTGAGPFTAAAPPPVALPWADLMHCLARAFLPPRAELTAGAWCEALAGDLNDLGRELGLDVTEAIDTLRRAGSGPATDEPWLVEYSRLFLVPPVPVTLNTGIYLEGALAGGSAQMMAQCYAAAGFAQRDEFRDLPDHVAMQLEFVGSLLGRSADDDDDALAMALEFIEGFVAHWAPPLRVACGKASTAYPAAAVYAALADVLQAATGRILQ